MPTVTNVSTSSVKLGRKIPLEVREAPAYSNARVLSYVNDDGKALSRVVYYHDTMAGKRGVAILYAQTNADERQKGYAKRLYRTLINVAKPDFVRDGREKDNEAMENIHKSLGFVDTEDNGRIASVLWLSD